ncbi:MAG: signal peptide peptidase SppA [bacterium]|nr:signal peptide peptidase SppA [bacterium]
MKRGVLITILVLVVLFIIMALVGGFIYMQFTSEPFVASNSYLRINLSGQIADSEINAFSKKDSIRDLWYQISRAKIDNRISGIVMKISYLRTDFAKLEDLGQMLTDFRKSGKKVYAYLEEGSIRGYYLATFADKVYLFKGGNLFLSGLASEAMFLKNSLSKLGVRADMFHIGDYKTASNMFTEDHMTDAHKESITELLDDIYDYTLMQIAANRKLTPAQVRNVFEETPTSNEDYLKAKMIDGIIYEDEILKNESGSEVSFATYSATTAPRPFKGAQKVAIIFAGGEIHSGKSGGRSLFGGNIMGSGTVAKQLRSARLNSSVKAVVLRIDSPGGSAVASDVIRREAELLAKEKPLVISMSGVAASGGYWISMSSSHIFALPQTITGSIGVVFGKFVLKDLYDSIGINKEVVKTSRYADIFSDYRAFDDEEKTKMISVMNNIYKAFLGIVSKNRNKSEKDIHAVAQGRVWAGNSAKEHGLIDKLGGLNAAIDEAKTLAKLQDNNFGIRLYPGKKTIFDVIGDYVSKTGVKSPDPLNTLDAKVGMYKNFFPALILPYQISFN